MKDQENVKKMLIDLINFKILNVTFTKRKSNYLSKGFFERSKL